MASNRPWFGIRRPEPEPSSAAAPAAPDSTAPQPSGALSTSVPSDAPMEAQRVPAQQATETLYKYGRPVYVPQADVDAWLADGFTRAPVDVQAALEAYRTLWQAALQTGIDYAADAMAQGHIRREGDAPKFLAERAHALAAQAWLDLHSALQLTYPTLEEGAKP